MFSSVKHNILCIWRLNIQLKKEENNTRPSAYHINLNISISLSGNYNLSWDHAFKLRKQWSVEPYCVILKMNKDLLKMKEKDLRRIKKILEFQDVYITAFLLHEIISKKLVIDTKQTDFSGRKQFITLSTAFLRHKTGH